MLDEGIIRKTYIGPIDTVTPVPIPFPFDNKTDVKLLKVAVDGTKSYPTYGSGYTVDDSSNVFLISGIVLNESITVYRESVMDQQRDFVEDGMYRVTEVEKAIDKLTMQNQEQNDSIARALRTAMNTPIAFDAELPSPMSGRAICFTEDALGFEVSDVPINELVAQAQIIGTQAQINADLAVASATSATSSASSAAASAVAAANSAQLAGEILVVNGNGKSFLADDGTYKTSGSIETQNKGTVSASFTAETNKAILANITAPITITLPAGLDSSIKNTIILDFSSTVSALPILSTTGTVCWSSLNNNNRPASCSTDSTQRNQLVLETVDGGVLWNAEFKTYKQRSSDTVIYGFYIDSADSNPNTRVHYVQDNAAFADPAYMNFTSDTFHYGDWSNPFFFPRPVMLKYDGTEGYGLNVNDYTKKTDGTASDIASPAYGGNAMMDWSTIYTKRYTDGNYQYVLKSNKQIDSSWKPYSWYNKNNVLKEHCYMGIYQPASISSVLRSLSGQTILVNAAGATELAQAQANGASYGWYTGVWSDWIEVQELLVLMCKSTDIQSKFGYGRGSAANAVTGECNTKGLFYGTAGNGPVKIFGMENWYGNYWKRIAGSCYTASGHAVKMTQGNIDGSTATDYNSTGTGYIVPGLTMSGTSGGFINAATLTPYGFLPTAVSGSSSTYFCDGGWYAAGSYALVGGSYADGLSAGAFALSLGNAFSVANAAFGASLSCKPL